MKNFSILNRYLQSTRIALCFTVALTGCKVGPDYHLPSTSAQNQWVSTAADPKAEIEQNWWRHFNDPILNQFIAKAIAGNPDLKIAESRITQARALRATARNDLLPTVDMQAGADREANRVAFGNVPFDIAKPYNTYQAGFDASWELDLFGGKRREIESANADLQTAEAARDDARVSLLAEVARTYVDIRQYQAQAVLAQSTIDAGNDVVKIAKERFKVGEAPGIDATQAEAQVEQARSQLPYYQNLEAQAEFSMDVLMAENPGATHGMVNIIRPIPMADNAVVLAAPAKVIASRPDIRMAERKLASATAQQGVATAQFYPDISLSGFLGLLSPDAGDLLRTSSKSWDIGGNVLWPILNYGRLTANQHLNDARQQEALTQYQKSVIVALNDVERSMTAYTKEQIRKASMQKMTDEDAIALKVARDRYRQGLVSFIEVLDAERTLYDAQSQQAASAALVSKNLIAVYKSLGGGWKEQDFGAKAIPARP